MHTTRSFFSILCEVFFMEIDQSITYIRFARIKKIIM